MGQQGSKTSTAAPPAHPRRGRSGSRTKRTRRSSAGSRSEGGAPSPRRDNRDREHAVRSMAKNLERLAQQFVLPLPPAGPAYLPKLADYYDVGGEIGVGGSATVRECTRKRDGAECAVKIIDKTKLKSKSIIIRELKVLALAAHERIVRLEDRFETATHFFLVMEHCSGGELFDRIIEQQWLSEREASHIVQSIAEAVAHLHRKGIVHRDLKPENILFSTRDADAEVKVADFGFCLIVDEDDARQHCGTMEYAAPEMLAHGEAVYASDMWALGVILYILLTGVHPFHHEDRRVFMNNIVSCTYSMPETEWTGISTEAKELVRGLLVRSPLKRLTAEEVLAHAWLKNTMLRSQEPIPAAVENMKEYQRIRKGFVEQHRAQDVLKSIANMYYDKDDRHYKEFIAVDDHAETLVDHAIAIAAYGGKQSYEKHEFLAELQDTDQIDLLDTISKELFAGGGDALDDEARRTFFEAAVQAPSTPLRQQQGKRQHQAEEDSDDGGSDGSDGSDGGVGGVGVGDDDDDDDHHGGSGGGRSGMVPDSLLDMLGAGVGLFSSAQDQGGTDTGGGEDAAAGDESDDSNAAGPSHAPPRRRPNNKHNQHKRQQQQQQQRKQHGALPGDLRRMSLTEESESGDGTDNTRREIHVTTAKNKGKEKEKERCTDEASASESVSL